MKRSGFSPKIKPQSGLLRTAQLKAEGKPTLSAKPKLRKCQVCKTSFEKRSMSHVACSPACALKVAANKRLKAERQVLKVRKEESKDLGTWIAETQTVFNAYIRARDKDLPCICCGEWTDKTTPGGVWDAGHYRSRGSAGHLRFDERNVHKQLKQCNRYGAGRVADYRIGLIAKIGLEAVEA